MEADAVRTAKAASLSCIDLGQPTTPPGSEDSWLAVDRQFKRGEGEEARYDNENLQGMLRSSIGSKMQTTIARSGHPIPDVLFANYHDDYENATKEAVNQDLAQFGLEMADLILIGLDTTDGLDSAATEDGRISVHASGPAPAGWEGRVVFEVASTQVVSEDPGHTYHLLRDGSLVATSEDKLVTDTQITQQVNQLYTERGEVETSSNGGDTGEDRPLTQLSAEELLTLIQSKVSGNFRASPTRQAYEAEVRDLRSYADTRLADLDRSNDASLEPLAREMNRLRLDIGKRYKDLTILPLREYIFFVNQRYDTPMGPTYDFLRTTKSNSQIIDGSCRPNPNVDDLLRNFGQWLAGQPLAKLQQYAEVCRNA